MSEKRVRVGFIGSGGIAGTHIGYLKTVPGVEIIALSDSVQAAMDARIKQHDLKDVKTFTDYRQMLKLKDIDAVSVCTPNYLHYKPTVDALRAGKHVLVEKPMAMNAREAQAMCDAAKKAKKVLTIGFQQRFRPDAQFVRRAVAEGQFGDIVYCRAQALRRRGIPSWGVFGRKDLQGGGPLIDIGVHIIELTHFLIGKPKPVAASSQVYTYLGDKKPEGEPTTESLAQAVDQIISDFCEQYNDTPKAMEIVDREFQRAKVSIQTPTKDALLTAIEYLSDVERDVHGRDVSEVNKLRRWKMIDEAR